MPNLIAVILPRTACDTCDVNLGMGVQHRGSQRLFVLKRAALAAALSESGDAAPCLAGSSGSSSKQAATATAANSGQPRQPWPALASTLPQVTAAWCGCLQC